MMAEFIKAILEQAKDSICVARPGIVTKVDNLLRLVDVQPSISRFIADAKTPELEPIIAAVPIAYPATLGMRFTFPLNIGDSVMLIFGDRNQDTWKKSFGIGVLPQLEKRSHNIADCIAIPLRLTVATPLEISDAAIFGYNPDTDFWLWYNGANIVMRNGKIGIGNAAAELLSMFDELIGILQTATVMTALGPQPFIGPGPIGTQLELFLLRTKLALLKGP